MFSIQPEAADSEVEAMKEALLSLPGKIPQIVDHELGVDLKLEGGQNHPAGKNREIGWTVTFASKDDYEIYETHPDHLAVISDFIKPVTSPGSRSAIQYEYK